MHFPPEGSKMKSKMFLLIPVFALAVCGVFAYSLLAQASDEIDIPFHKFVLNNGLTLIVHEDHKAPIVAVNVWYHVGSKNERLGKTGFAHLFEHLMFGGSEHAPGRYIDAMEKIGATASPASSSRTIPILPAIPILGPPSVTWPTSMPPP